MNESIFRMYDIRGVVERDFSEEVVTDLGRAFGTFVQRQGGRSVALSGDIRLSTPALKGWFGEGLLETGTEIIDIGTVPTPANYFSMYHLDVDGAVQITGSHNPPEFNGFKLSYRRAAVYGEQIQDLLALIQKGDFERGVGSRREEDILTPYLDMLADKIELERPLKVAMDCGNAAGALTAPAIFKRLGVQLTELFCEVDGRFPNHHPDPTEIKNLAQLIAEVKSGQYDFGVAYDGDADRVGIVDDQGEVVWADTLMALFLDEVAKPGEAIIFDVKCSQALEEEIVRHGAKPVMWKTGHSLIKEKMRELQVGFAGEMSGHLFFGDEFYGFDDAVYVSLRLARFLSRRKERLSDLIARIPSYYSTPEMRLACPTDEEKFRIAQAAETYFKERYECIDIDGVRIQFGDGWGLVRASNTQPVIVCRFEARTPQRRDEIQAEVLGKLGDFGEIEMVG
ncbi:MAG: phosphomannomutase/phosphoglucomutase [Candidatus Marinimicrobia bacterium]|nr:phosphomannomutase/phosphoglucomutase [Candidatus Neomarinimicrobiota bacterium]